MAESTAETMKLVGGDPSIDFVNTVGGRIGAGRGGTAPNHDKLLDYASLVGWARHAGLVGEAVARRLLRLASEHPTEAGRVLERAVAMREALYRALRAIMTGRRPDGADLVVLNRELAATRARERLVPGPQGLHWDADGSTERLDAVLEPVHRAVSALLTSGDLSRLRQCTGDDCGWLFLDHSRNHSRQWCTMDDCGNVAKVRRFRERQRE